MNKRLKKPLIIALICLVGLNLFVIWEYWIYRSFENRSHELKINRISYALRSAEYWAVDLEAGWGETSTEDKVLSLSYIRSKLYMAYQMMEVLTRYDLQGVGLLYGESVSAYDQAWLFNRYANYIWYHQGRLLAGEDNQVLYEEFKIITADIKLMNSSFNEEAVAKMKYRELAELFVEITEGLKFLEIAEEIYHNRQ